MSRTLGIVITVLTILPSYVSAQAPTCLSGYSWMFNSLNQSPCTMTVALGGACTNGAFTLDPLQPGFEYLGPSVLGANSCRCSTVYYSVLSACAVCQNQTYLDWSIYDFNCTTVYNQGFLDPIPSSTRIPHYAYLDVVTPNAFNVIAAENAGGLESTPVPQATGTTITQITASSTIGSLTDPTQTVVVPKFRRKKSNAGPIAGGVVGGVGFIALVGGLIVLLRRRRRSGPSGPSGPVPSTYSSVTYNSLGSPQTVMDYGDGKYNSPSPATMVPGKIYDSNDPTTFPASNPVSLVGHTTYSALPDRNQWGPITPTFPGNVTHVSTTPVGAARTQYTGVPEL